MLILRVGKIQSPIELDCSGCQQKTPPGDVFISETDPTRDMKKEIIIHEFSTWCSACYYSMKDAAQRLHIPIEYDVTPENVRYVPEERLTERKF